MSLLRPQRVTFVHTQRHDGFRKMIHAALVRRRPRMPSLMVKRPWQLSNARWTIYQKHSPCRQPSDLASAYRQAIDKLQQDDYFRRLMQEAAQTSITTKRVMARRDPPDCVPDNSRGSCQGLGSPTSPIDAPKDVPIDAPTDTPINVKPVTPHHHPIHQQTKHYKPQ